MHPVLPGGHYHCLLLGVPPHLQGNVQRSWSDEHIPVNSYSRDPTRHAPRSSSFSASRAPQPQWNTYPPPPPVPPLPPSLLPGFYSPPLAHANLDFTFPPHHPLLSRPSQPGSFSNDPSSSHGFTPPHQATDSALPWPSTDQRNHFTPTSHFAPPRPSIPPPPTVSYGYIPNTPNLADSRPVSHTLAQSFSHLEGSLPPPSGVPPAVLPRRVSAHGELRFERSPTLSFQPAPSLSHTVPPPVLPRPVSTHSELRFERSPTMSLQAAPVLPRPVSAHGEARFERSPTTSLQAAPSLPAVPPKTFTLVMPREHIPTPPEHAIVSPSSNALPIPDTSMMTRPPPAEPQVLETTSLDPGLRRSMTLSPQESQRRPSEVETLRTEEDNELVRSLAESLSFSPPLQQDAVQARKYLQTGIPYLTIATQSPVEQDNLQQHAQSSSGVSETPSRRRPFFLDLGGIDILSPEELEDHAALGQIMQALEDEEVTRRLQEEEERRLAAELREREREDEEVTRQLQQEEEKRLAAEREERERADAERARIDAEFTRRLQEEEAMRLEAEKREREQRDEAWARMDAEIARREGVEEHARKMIREAQERKDADMARRMAETDDDGRGHAPRKMIREAQERKDAEMARRMAETNGAGQAYAPRGVSRGRGPARLSKAPPQYNDIVGASRGFVRPTVRTAQSAPQVRNGSPPATRSRAASAFPSGFVRPAEQGDHARPAVTDRRGGTERYSDGGLRPEGVAPPSRDPSPGRSNSARPSASPSRTSPSAGPIVAPEDNAVEADLLKGVSYGFKPPDTHSVPSQSGGLLACLPFPEVISLLRAPSPPFHIMATSWRHLMRLLGQLETRLEANIDAIAQSKEDYLLRVVVQFTKLPHSVNTWRTILYLTLDQPIPRDVQNTWRSQNRDTTTLPYSYTLGEPMPHLVNDAKSQFYVIPLSAASPFPKLPTTLPDLAMYLQSAMRDSRMGKVQNVPSNGLRRLAKMMADCYPEEVSTDQEGRKPRGVGNLFKRVVGLGGEREASRVNEDVYDIITPFRIDQYTVTS